jgi:hypothetical protein
MLSYLVKLRQKHNEERDRAILEASNPKEKTWFTPEEAKALLAAKRIVEGK